MSYGKMRTPVQLLSTEAVKDAEGFATQQDKVLAEVRAYHEARHGSERWANRAAYYQCGGCKGARDVCGDFSEKGGGGKWLRYRLKCRRISS